MIIEPSKFPSRNRNIIPWSVAVVGACGALVAFGDISCLCNGRTEHEWKAKDGKLEKQDGKAERRFCFPRKLFLNLLSKALWTQGVARSIHTLFGGRQRYTAAVNTHISPITETPLSCPTLYSEEINDNS